MLKLSYIQLLRVLVVIITQNTKENIYCPLTFA